MSKDKEKVTLATFVGQGDQLEIDGHILVRGVQYEVTRGMKTRLKARSDVQVIDAEAGSEQDVRPMVEVPELPALGPDDAPSPVEQDPNLGEPLEPDTGNTDDSEEK